VEARAQALRVEHLPVVLGEPQVFAQARTDARNLELGLVGRIPSVVIRIVPPDAIASVALDQMLLPGTSLGFPFKVNPGAHQLRVSASGYRAVSQSFSLNDAENRELVVELQREPSTSEAAAVPTKAETRDEASSDYSARDWAQVRSIVGFSLGGAGLATGLVSGLVTVSRVHSIKQKYCTDSLCEPAAKPALDRANTGAWVANIGIGVGVVGIGYGLYELIWGGPARETASARPTLAGLFPEFSGGNCSLNFRGKF
jgi:hypothetical protein